MKYSHFVLILKPQGGEWIVGWFASSGRKSSNACIVPMLTSLAQQTNVPSRRDVLTGNVIRNVSTCPVHKMPAFWPDRAGKENRAHPAMLVLK